MNNLILKTGSLAFLDTAFSGLIPCKVLSIKAPNDKPKSGMVFDLTLGGISTSIKTKVKITKTTIGYKKDEIIESDAAHTVPRKAVFNKDHHIWIKGYQVIVD